MGQRKLILKQPDELDRRSVRIFLTDLGKQKKIAAVKTIKEFNEKVKNALTEREITYFFSLFDKIHRVIDLIQK